MEQLSEFKQETRGEFKAVCTKCKKTDWLTETYIEGEKQLDILCYNCAEEAGFCFGCGSFSAGNNEYDTSRLGAYCGACQDEIRDVCDDDRYDFDDYCDFDDE